MVGLSPAQSSLLVARLGLTAASDPKGERLLDYLAQARETGCRSIAGLPFSGWDVWYAAGRPPQLRTPAGAAFEYLVLYYATEQGRGCIELSYAYG